MDQLFKSKVTDEVLKCPLCNTEVTIEKIKESRKADKEKRKQKKANMIIPVVNEISNVGMNGPNEVAGTEINS